MQVVRLVQECRFGIRAWSTRTLPGHGINVSFFCSRHVPLGAPHAVKTNSPHKDQTPDKCTPNTKTRFTLLFRPTDPAGLPAPTRVHEDGCYDPQNPCTHPTDTQGVPHPNFNPEPHPLTKNSTH